MGKKWTQKQDDFLKFLHHAGQSFNEMHDDFMKVFKVKRTPKALKNRFYKLGGSKTDDTNRV